jgi:vanillate O-demethylase monooxygenase subunit
VTQPKKFPEGDFWSRIDYLVPGIYISHGQLYAVGTAEACGGLPPGPDARPLTDGISIQAVTPVTARKTRYSFSVGSQATDMDEEESDHVWEIVMRAFSEDLHMIQAQQTVIDSYPGTRMGGIAVDRGLVMFRNLVKQLISREGIEDNQTTPSLSP